jgi:hypothetical protein
MSSGKRVKPMDDYAVEEWKTSEQELKEELWKRKITENALKEEVDILTIRIKALEEKQIQLQRVAGWKTPYWDSVFEDNEALRIVLAHRDNLIVSLSIKNENLQKEESTAITRLNEENKELRAEIAALKDEKQ